jgi:D-glycero-alpha-D-manno-heptose-7-phosphate kinase
MIFSRAPFRITLGGGGTDLPSYYSQFGGFILSAAINKYLYIYVNRPAADNLIRVKYSRYEQVSSPAEIQHDLVRPTLQELNLSGSLEIASMADVPAGSGLGSSSTYLVALLTALYELKREKIPTQALAEKACHIEMDLAGHPVGKQDHYLAAFGGITCLDIQKDGRVKVSPLDISISTVEEFRSSVLLFYTGINRSSNDILEVQNKATQNGDMMMIENLHRTKEMGYRVKEALEHGDLENFGYLLHEHWLNKKHRSDNISDKRIDAWYETARKKGVLGGKLIGAGGGGFFMFYAPNHSKQALRKAMKDYGLHEMHFDFDFEGAKVLINF